MLQLRMSRTLLLDQGLTMIAGAILGLLFREVSVALQNFTPAGIELVVVM